MRRNANCSPVEECNCPGTHHLAEFEPPLKTHSGEKSNQCDYASRYLLVQTLWGDIWKHTVATREESLRNLKSEAGMPRNPTKTTNLTTHTGCASFSYFVQNLQRWQHSTAWHPRYPNSMKWQELNLPGYPLELLDSLNHSTLRYWLKTCQRKIFLICIKLGSPF